MRVKFLAQGSNYKGHKIHNLSISRVVLTYTRMHAHTHARTHTHTHTHIHTHTHKVKSLAAAKCGSKSGVGGIFFPSLSLFCFVLFVPILYISSKAYSVLMCSVVGNPKAAAHVAIDLQCWSL